MKVIRIKAFPKNKSQLKTIEGAEFVSFLTEMEGSLGQIKKIQSEEIKKELASEFLNEL